MNSSEIINNLKVVLYEILWIINISFEISKKDKPFVIVLFNKCV